MFLRNTRILFSVGAISLAGAILLQRFGGQSGRLAFISGMLTGIALVFLLAYLIIQRGRRDSR
jgi:hypothetical protein